MKLIPHFTLIALLVVFVSVGCMRPKCIPSGVPDIEYRGIIKEVNGRKEVSIMARSRSGVVYIDEFNSGLALFYKDDHKCMADLVVDPFINHTIYNDKFTTIIDLGLCEGIKTELEIVWFSLRFAGDSHFTSQDAPVWNERTQSYNHDPSKYERLRKMIRKRDQLIKEGRREAAQNLWRSDSEEKANPPSPATGTTEDAREKDLETEGEMNTR